jgi:hypothetical protein
MGKMGIGDSSARQGGSMFDLPKKRIALSCLICTAFFSLTGVNTQFQNELYYQNEGVTGETQSLAKIEKLRPLIYLEKEN